MQAQLTAAKVMTDLTCWKCGEESLKEVAVVADSFSLKGERVSDTGIRHSDCQKCGAYSVSPAQVQYNRTVARANRKAVIKEANRKSV
jgi:formylmethanofuran dehydrogenase subunit E